MKVSINWIKDFVDLDGVDIDELIGRFTMSVAEVEGVEHKGRDISNVVTARILSVENVPNSKKLHLLKVDAGEDSPLQIVCGAPNVRVGQVTALAKVGAKLGNIEISKATLAGIDSYGMCCGGDEIGISDDHSGIVELPEDTKVGLDIKHVLDIEDTIFEVDNKSLTNRPDLWGHYGIAREIATLLNRELKELSLEDLKDFEGKNGTEININSPDCYRYTCATLSNVTRKTSLYNMQIRLFYCGMRAINLLADATNYVMLELGQPMHAFDGEKVEKIEVYNLDKDTPFKTLDSSDRLLKAGHMVIATNGEVVALAGIMGGENSEITDDTTCVTIESACFDAYKVRTTALSLGMRTEASARYEKSLDPELTMKALLRYIYLVKLQDKGAVISSNITDVYNKHYDKKIITISKEYIDNFIGITIDENTILNILTSLKFKLLNNENGEYTFEVPSFRATKDINGKADLVEEITRIYGYDNIDPKTLKQTLKPAVLDNNIKMEYDAKFTLADRFSLNETHSYIWYDTETNNFLKLNPNSVIRVVNSLNKDNDKIRSTIIPSLLKVIIDNKGSFDSFGTFEIGRVVKGLLQDGLADETKSLGVVLYDKYNCIEEQLHKIKNILEYLFINVLKIDLDLVPCQSKIDYYLDKNYYKIYSSGVELGDLFTIHYNTSSMIDDNCSVVGFEVNFSKITTLQQMQIKFEKLSKYPTTKLDFNFVIPKDKYYRDIINIAKSINTDLNYSVSLLDIYENKDETKSYTLHYNVNSLDRTLISEDIENFHKEVINAFAKNNIYLKQ